MPSHRRHHHSRCSTRTITCRNEPEKTHNTHIATSSLRLDRHKTMYTPVLMEDCGQRWSERNIDEPIEMIRLNLLRRFVPTPRLTRSSQGTRGEMDIADSFDWTRTSEPAPRDVPSMLKQLLFHWIHERLHLCSCCECDRSILHCPIDNRPFSCTETDHIPHSPRAFPPMHHLARHTMRRSCNASETWMWS